MHGRGLVCGGSCRCWRVVARAECSIVVIWLAGCANPGPPLPPSLHLPGVATSVRVERIGDEARITWVTPATTTDGDAVRGTITAVICRESPVGPPVSALRSGAVCDPVMQRVVSPGFSQAVETLPAALASGPPRLARYVVELRNDQGRSGGPSSPALAAMGAAPPAVGSLTVQAAREGALITWHREATSAVMEVTRHRQTAGGTESLAVDPNIRKERPQLPQRRKRANAVLAAPQSAPSRGESGDVVLRAAQSQEAVGNEDSGGVVDPGVRMGPSTGARYSYVGQRVQQIELGGHLLEIRGRASPAAELAYRDVFPPRPPAGLQAIPGGSFGGTPYVDLSWEPNTEDDLLGYNIFRSDESNVPTRLNTVPLLASTFHDSKVQAGRAYTYTVTALDQHGNESEKSTAVRETPRK